MIRKPYTPGRIYIGRLPKGADLLGSIARIANEESIKVATVAVHGSIAHAHLTIFDQRTKQQESIERDEGLEILAVSGTISQFKGRSMPRLSGVFSSANGTIIGGTIALGTEVYACEVVITELEGGTLTRDFDPETGMPLWKANSMLIDE